MLCFAAHLFYFIFQASGLSERERERERGVMENTSVEYKMENGKKLNLLNSETEKGKIETENQCLKIMYLTFRSNSPKIIWLCYIINIVGKTERVLPVLNLLP